MPGPSPEARAILAFWFGTEDDPAFCTPRTVWFRANAAFDQAVDAHCQALHLDAAAGRLDHWAQTPLGSLALLILLDQVPRNLFRGTPRAYATDRQALAHARTAVDAGFDRLLRPVQRWFIYLPFEHAETLADQIRSVALFDALKDDPASAAALDSVRRHHEIIARFGRFPHRNAILGRASTAAEEAFLKEPNSSF
ncbi:MAG: DUF924 domain-containing protein [Proteobacteria bacterium]|nr:DUF924 domain-containing protein [Pseudomonadota bacterium]